MCARAALQEHTRRQQVPRLRASVLSVISTFGRLWLRPHRLRRACHVILASSHRQLEAHLHQHVPVTVARDFTIPAVLVSHVMLGRGLQQRARRQPQRVLTVLLAHGRLPLRQQRA